MSNVTQFPGSKKQDQPTLAPLKCIGVSRDAECPIALSFMFNRQPTDDEMRDIHEGIGHLAYISYVANLNEDGEV
jgi:hypothetical protein